MRIFRKALYLSLCSWYDNKGKMTRRADCTDIVGGSAMKEFLPKSAAKMADCLMKRYGLLTSRWSYDYGVAWRGMEALYALTGEKKYFDYIKDAMDTFVTDESGAIRDYTLDEFNLDYICNGRQLLYLYKATGDKKYLRAADVPRDPLRPAMPESYGSADTDAAYIGKFCRTGKRSSMSSRSNARISAVSLRGIRTRKAGTVPATVHASISTGICLTDRPKRASA